MELAELYLYLGSTLEVLKMLQVKHQVTQMVLSDRSGCFYTLPRPMANPFP